MKPYLLGVILPEFTEWALPYVLVEDDGQFVGDERGLVRVTHTTNLEPWEQRLLQHLAGKPLFHKQKYQCKDTVGSTAQSTCPRGRTRTAAWIRCGS